MKKIAILGSTGSIGTQSLDVIRNMENVTITGLSCNKEIDLLEQQIDEFSPEIVCVIDTQQAAKLRERLKAKHSTTQVVSGIFGLTSIAKSGEDLLITAVVGIAGLVPTLAAIEAGIDIALANKETLVCAGELVMERAKIKGVQIIPVDSEHCAIFECLQAGTKSEVSKLLLTASGGPFRDYAAPDLADVTVEQALKHPNWTMGKKITIDSATLMNKGLEVIEARFLFDISPENIDVVVHKESIIHSMVEFVDKSIIAQLGVPDMRHPISYAINYPNRVDTNLVQSLDFKQAFTLHFSSPNTALFPCLDLAFEALKAGGTAPLVLNGANEIAVELFLQNKIRFLDIPKLIHKTLDKHIIINSPTLDEILDIDKWARAQCYEGVR
ncbi:1-deoxy-D-xylulose-5-phosphate reductoisomerase [Candidatus Epulonipiscium viviparus]|uniref:1-deoxy-D-xylulose-5-phosphate reductoisomerase n=1 Tax=Candidatus Epulonipiscium viviparus TaxID=420336 RepID=UPI00016BFCC0|nr:1-deoxy-D-xylulose-5-phosphate reductoisomerase [Candidatus Epulopiscium viviparus]